jgi:hypothetical protein
MTIMSFWSRHSTTSHFKTRNLAVKKKKNLKAIVKHDQKKQTVSKRICARSRLELQIFLNLDPMLQAVELPSSITHLNSCNAAAAAATEKNSQTQDF